MLSLYDITVPNYIRLLEATVAVMEVGETFLTENNIDLSEITSMRLSEDMLPFHSQVNIGSHNAVGCIKALFDGEFRPPSVSLENYSYAELKDFLVKSVESLKSFNKDEVDARFGQPLYFKFSDQSVPFTTENFVMSFASPNVYFHATTIYDMLRLKGAPLSKTHFLGQMAVGIPE